MVNKLIKDQLTKVEKADLSHFNEADNSYYIPKRKDIKLEENKCYLIHIKDSFFKNEIVKINWNGGSVPTCAYLRCDISKVMPQMVKVVGIGFDIENNVPLNYFWSGWLTINDIEILVKDK